MFGEWQSYPPNPGGMPIKSDRLNMWTVRIRTRELRRAPLGKESLHCKTHLCKSIVKSYRTPALHGLAPFPPHLAPKAPQKRLISKVSKPFRQSLPNPWLPPLRGKSFRSASRCGESCGGPCGGRVGESPTCSRRALWPSSGTEALDGQSG